MAELKLTLTDSKITRVKAAINDKYGDDRRTINQLVKDDVKGYLKSLVVQYEKRIAVEKISLADF